jgi:hypothetical protein
VAKPAQEGPSDLSPLRSNGSSDGQAGKQDHCEEVAIDTQKLARSQGGLSGLGSLRSDGSCGNRAGKLDCGNCGQRCSRESQKRILGSPVTSLKIDSQRNTYKRSQLGFQLPARPLYYKTGFTKSIQLLLSLEIRIKAIFLVFVDTVQR